MSDGLQPNNNGLQPNSDGLQPRSDGLQTAQKTRFETIAGKLLLKLRGGLPPAGQPETEMVHPRRGRCHGAITKDSLG